MFLTLIKNKKSKNNINKVPEPDRHTEDLKAPLYKEVHYIDS